MIGRFKPEKNKLTGESLKVYRSMYCTLCKSMRRFYGGVAATCLPADVVWLAICLDNETGEIAGLPDAVCRCPFPPFRRACIKDPSYGVNARLADLAAFCIRLMMIDGEIDEGRPGFFRRTGQRIFRKMTERNRERMGRVKKELAGDEEPAMRLRGDAEASLLPEERIRPNAEWLGECFSLALDPDGKFPEFGIIVSETVRTLYYLDALTDYHRDRYADKSNILSEMRLQPGSIVRYVYRQVLSSTQRIRTLIKTGIRSDIIENILRQVEVVQTAAAMRTFMKEAS